ncbi:MAG: DUF1080 domain-containing protein [Gammaproteobacteria bacterium]|nr:DUF1080 domain-containing protein [Gammaproteobacteria bacterium]MBU1556131.1 DUF1080 domain-containing protein [Gammaproteobacteria bacterium]MBU2070753.1 DUF1080 domain-containing protein [Gammaproteobacteria bacterium]MBU2182744.1 DUF1080 domain-containing protein [Gammaproteobacteria bacterium]MBU2206014.1 DUF1080 domain-containing protein [Gammaproteobacteria bacterium]
MNRVNSGAFFRTAALGMLLSAAITGCKPAATTTESTVQAAATTTAAAAPWQWLFNGDSMAAWTGNGGKAPGEQWQIIDSTLVLTAGGGGDIVSKQSFSDFELELEWQIAAAGNSGIFYKVAGVDGAVWSSGLEYQLLDDDNYPGHDNPIHFSASLFDIYAPQVDAHLPAGSWNTTRIVVRHPQVEHWLNGKLVLQFELGSADWLQRTANSKFATMDAFAKTERGHIALQDHGDRVAFRQIRIRAL